MIKKLLTSLLMLVGFAMYAQAQQDTMYVVKEGKIVGTFEVGKDIDGITFKNPLTPSLEDFVKYGDTNWTKVCYSHEHVWHDIRLY